jgi:ArsR family transcriptional regulator
MGSTYQNSDRCDCDVIHEDVVAAVKAQMPEEESLMDLADLFKVFGDTTRVKILYALLHAEMCVCDLAVLLNLTKSATSHQLRSLRMANLVKNRRSGKEIYYKLADDHVRSIFEKGFEHVNE